MKEDNIIEEKSIYIKLLEKLVKQFFINVLEGSSIKEIDSDILRIRLSKQNKQLIIQELSLIKKELDKNSEALKLLDKYLLSETSAINLCFNYENMVKTEENLFIDINHPLLKVILKILSEENMEFVTSIKVQNSELSIGKYLFFCYQWKEIGYKKQEYIDIIFYNLENKKILNIDLANFERMLLTAKDCEIHSNLDEEFKNIINDIEKHIFIKHQQKKEKLNLFNQELVHKKLSSLNSYYDHQINKLEKDLLVMDNKKIKLMKNSQIKRNKITWEIKKQELEAKLKIDIVTNLFAKGYLEVR